MKIASFITHLFLFCFLLLPELGQAQLSKKELKTYKKAIKLSEKGKYDDAIETIKPLTISHSDEPQIWEAYVDFYSAKYASRLKFGSNISINVSSKNGSDSMSSALAALLKQAFNGNREKEDYIHAMRLATLKCAGLDNIGMQLRNISYDNTILFDTNISEKGMAWFDKAEIEFMNGNYLKAAGLYQKAIDSDSHFYKAQLYLGDSYYALKDYSKAAPIFRNAIESQPKLIEPRKYYFDALYHMESYEKAKECAVASLLVFPDEGMMSKLAILAILEGKSLEKHWMPREYFPFSVKEKNPEATNHWKFYFEAATKIAPYVNKIGTLNPNEITKEVYPEVYCWEYMLANAPENIEELKTAREMKSLNKLDCYVLYSLFHIDLMNQAAHLAQNNEEKVQKYILDWLK
jgi:tetratricopeptide (TPR) repeat protein